MGGGQWAVGSGQWAVGSEQCAVGIQTASKSVGSNAEGVRKFKPRVSTLGYVICIDCTNSERVRYPSVPKIPLVIFDLIFPQKLPILIFKCHPSVMPLLILYVAAYPIEMRLANREGSVSILPMKFPHRR